MLELSPEKVKWLRGKRLSLITNDERVRRGDRVKFQNKEFVVGDRVDSFEGYFFLRMGAQLEAYSAHTFAEYSAQFNKSKD